MINWKISNMVKNKYLLLLLVLPLGNSFAQNLVNSGSINNPGIFRVKNNVLGLADSIGGVFDYFGINQTVLAIQYKDLLLTGSGIKETSGGNFTVTNNITIDQGVTFQIENGSVLKLGGELFEQGYLNGSIQKDVELSGTQTISDFGKIGATISWSGVPPGNTIVRRTSGIAQTGNGYESVLRYYDIIPQNNNGYTADFILKYSGRESNSHNPAKLLLWKSVDSNKTWRKHDGSLDTSQRIMASSTNALQGRWTFSDSDHPIGDTNVVHTIYASATSNGSIYPSGEVKVVQGTDQSFTIAANPGCRIDSVIVDGVNFYILPSYTFINVTTDHSIRAYFSIHYGSISGIGFHDINGNGIRDEGETGVADWKIRLKKNGVFIDSVYTAADGSYQFSNLIMGNYEMSQAYLQDWTATLPTAPEYYTVELQSGQLITDMDFGKYKNGILAGTVFYDRNANGIYDSGEQGLTGWNVFAEATNPLNSRSVRTDPGGVYEFNDLAPDAYMISQEFKTGWTQTLPIDGRYFASVVGGVVITDLNFGSSFDEDTIKYRTFLPESLAQKKEVSRRKIASSWCFEFSNNTGNKVDGLQVTFNRRAKSFTNIGHFIIQNSLSSSGRDWHFSGATINNGQIIRICGKASPYNFYALRWWWTKNSSIIGGKQSRKNPTDFYYELPMPNTGTVRRDVFQKGGFPKTNTLPKGGMLIGIARTDNPQNYGWVVLQKSNDLRRSLVDRSGYHTGPPRGFTVFNSGGPFVRKQSSLSPTRHDNRLFANLVALKFSIASSALGVTPVGLGELVLEDGQNPLSGMMLKEIVAKGDTLMTEWKGRPEAEYINLDTTLQKINKAFEGPIDTVSFGRELVVKGIKSLQGIKYLYSNPGVTPVTITPDENVEEQLPQVSALYQNYPNPFNPLTTIEFDLPNPSIVTVKIYNVLGQDVGTLIETEAMDEGVHDVEFNATGFASGVYFYRIFAEQIVDEDSEAIGEIYTKVKKMVLIK